SDLRPAGYDLFSDSESYMHELSDSDLDNITGGLFTVTLTPITARITITITLTTTVTPIPRPRPRYDDVIV
ncbi:MAG TPA: hypothetical protein DCY88_32885, partial [Cyanobacteria bacterium UBA11372]|nr:hypothetical protein [Cyanobacteria bacterium UBA11372]